MTGRNEGLTAAAAQEREGMPDKSSFDVLADVRCLFTDARLRVGLDLRLLFKAAPGTLTFVFSGTHDDIQAYLQK